MTDNFNKIIPLLEFPKPKDSFYFLQILQRKKDFQGVRIGGSNNNSRLIKSYHIQSIEQLNIHKEEIIKMCEIFGARAGITLNPRSFEKTAFATMQKMANQMQNRAFSDVRKAYDSACGDYQSEMDKRWIIDIDTQDMEFLQEVKMYVTKLQGEILNREYKILSIIPSKSGYHIITNPFNRDKFAKVYPQLDLHGNNPTNLYIP